MSKAEFRVIVVGGGPTGLALANMLEQLSVNYVLLEAHGDITPRVGTGIFLSNSLRVLDQLGCLEAFYAGADEVDDLSVTLDDAVMFATATADHFRLRYGYETRCSHRQHLLNVLYGNLKDQSKILVNKRVSEIIENDSGVEVQTTDGQLYRGDIVIGADGVHSIVRKEMRRMAANSSPGHPLMTEEDKVNIEYAALFGIAYIDKPFPPGLLAMEANQGRSYLTYGNREGRIVWGLMEKLPEPIKGKYAPRYRQSDMDALVKKRFNDRIAPGITLGDLYKGSSDTHGMLPLQNWVFESWHYGRLVTVGDSAHKMVPITGQGCNMAIQDAAALVNSLTKRLDKYGGNIPKTEIEAAFLETEAARQEHVEYSRTDAYDMQESQAMQDQIFVKVFPFVAKSLSLDTKHEVNRKIMYNTAKINNLPLPYRPHFIPFADELPAKNISSGKWNAATAASYAGLWLTAKYLGTSDDTPGSLLKTAFSFLFRGGQAKSSTIATLPSATLYTTSLLAVITVYWTVERYRRCNRQAMMGPLMKPTAFYSALADLCGAETVVPAYLGLTAIKNAGPVATIMVGRPVRPAAIKSLVPATAVSFAAAAVAYWLTATSSGHADAVSCWRLAPLLIAPMTQFFYARTEDEENYKTDKKGLSDINNRDIPALKMMYGVVAAVAAVAHVSLIVLPWLSGSLGTKNLHAIFINREAFTLTGSLIGGAINAIVDTRVQGYATTWNSLRAGLVSLLALPVLGPAAVFTGARCWKEVTTARWCSWKHEKDNSKA